MQDFIQFGSGWAFIQGHHCAFWAGWRKIERLPSLHPDQCVTVQQDAGATYRDDIQDAEEAVDTVSWEHFLHHTFFAILKKEKEKDMHVRARL